MQVELQLDPLVFLAAAVGFALPYLTVFLWLSWKDWRWKRYVQRRDQQYWKQFMGE